ncbi:MAG: single-stranded DNA-binding protein [Eubacteriales bacterium]|nr:single-stranded DNA-binding protein [Eubacteriales bacterium]
MNKVVLLGRLTRDPELKKTNSNISVCRFTVAVDRRYRDANGERPTDFIPVVAWRNTAEFVSQRYFKGSRIAVWGSIQVRNYTDNDGSRRTYTEVVADDVELVDNRDERDKLRNQSSSGNRSYSNEYAPKSNSYGSDKSFYGSTATSTSDDFSAFGDFSDDDLSLDASVGGDQDNDTSLPFDI